MMSPPPPPLDLRAEVGDLPSGEAVVTWTTPPDRGPAGTLGFEVAVDGDPLPPSVVPLARLAPERNRLHLRDRRLPAGAAVKLTIRAVDAAGNVGPAARLDLAVSRRAPRPLPPGDTAPRADRPGRLAWNGGTVAVLDELDKFDPQRGTVIPPARASEDDLAANHLWDAARRQIVLTAARNEFVGFQVVGLGLRGPVTAGLRWTHRPGGSSPIGTIHRAIAVATPLGPLPDPVVPAVGPVDLATSPLYCEVYVPSDARPGVHDGKVTLQSPGATLELNVSLQVLDFALPDTLGFVPELNAYDLPEPELASYRLAHRHRTSLNRVPYSQRGVVAPGMAPPILADGRLDWAAWDARFGPLLDGSAFADLPRRGVPVASFYLPLHENWPTPIEGSYDGGYWADSSFKPGYRQAFVAASRRFAEHLDARGWTGPVFEGFLNNKRDFKAGGRGWSGGSSPWLLDEPASWQDFVALRYFAAAFHEGIAQARSQTRGQRPAKLAFRADISRPEWQRDGLDGLLDVNVVSGVMRDRQRLMMDRKRDQNQWMFEYGTANAVDQANVQPAAWCVDAWTLGMDGVIPWQTIGRAESWTKGDELALLYPPNPAGCGSRNRPDPVAPAQGVPPGPARRRVPDPLGRAPRPTPLGRRRRGPPGARPRRHPSEPRAPTTPARSPTRSSARSTSGPSAAGSATTSRPPPPGPIPPPPGRRPRGASPQAGADQPGSPATSSRHSLGRVIPALGQQPVRGGPPGEEDPDGLGPAIRARGERIDQQAQPRGVGLGIPAQDLQDTHQEPVAVVLILRLAQRRHDQRLVPVLEIMGEQAHHQPPVRAAGDLVQGEGADQRVSVRAESGEGGVPGVRVGVAAEVDQAGIELGQCSRGEDPEEVDEHAWLGCFPESVSDLAELVGGGLPAPHLELVGVSCGLGGPDNLGGRWHRPRPIPASRLAPSRLARLVVPPSFPESGGRLVGGLVQELGGPRRAEQFGRGSDDAEILPLPLGPREPFAPDPDDEAEAGFPLGLDHLVSGQPRAIGDRLGADDRAQALAKCLVARPGVVTGQAAELVRGPRLGQVDQGGEDGRPEPIQGTDRLDQPPKPICPVPLQLGIILTIVQARIQEQFRVELPDPAHQTARPSPLLNASSCSAGVGSVGGGVNGSAIGGNLGHHGADSLGQRRRGSGPGRSGHRVRAG